MRLPHALRLLAAVAAASAFGEATEKILAEEQEKTVQRKLKEHAVSTIERFLWLFQSDDRSKDMTEEEEEGSVRVKWDGKLLTPISSKESAHSRSLQVVHLPDIDTASILDSAREGFVPGNRRKIRRSRRQRNAKASSRTKKSTKGCKSTKGNEPLQVITKKARKGSNQEEILCFRGSPQDVADACALYNADCCVGDNACSWEDNSSATVCQGSCNGNQACLIPPGSFIDAGSCRGNVACFELNDGSRACEPVKVGRNSCTGPNACSRVCPTDQVECTVEIGDFSCNGLGACLDVGLFAPSVEIGSFACKDGDFACGGLGYFSKAAIRVDDYACTGRWSCLRVGDFAGEANLIKIDSGACQGNSPCTVVARYAEESIEIEQESCYGDFSCYFLGLDANVLQVGKDSCTSSSSCLQLGLRSNTLTIGKEACCEPDSCNQVGRNADGMVEIGDQACKSEGACRFLGANLIYGDVYIGKKACSAPESECNMCPDATFIPKGATSCY